MEHAHTVLSETWSFSGQLIGWTLQKGTGRHNILRDRSCFRMIYGYYYICLIERATQSQMKEKPLQMSLPGLENHHRYLFNPSHLQWNTNTVTSKNTCDPSWRNNKGNQSDGLSGFTRGFWCGIGPFQHLQPQAEDGKAVTKEPELGALLAGTPSNAEWLRWANPQLCMEEPILWNGTL